MIFQCILAPKIRSISGNEARVSVKTNPIGAMPVLIHRCGWQCGRWIGCRSHENLRKTILDLSLVLRTENNTKLIREEMGLNRKEVEDYLYSDWKASRSHDRLLRREGRNSRYYGHSVNRASGKTHFRERQRWKRQDTDWRRRYDRGTRNARDSGGRCGHAQYHE